MLIVYHGVSNLPETKDNVRYHTIIWDWNGTLLHDAALCRQLMNGLLSSRNMPRMSRRKYEDVFDIPVTNYYRRIGFDFDQESFEQLGDLFMAGYEQSRHTCRLQRGARKLLEDLHRNGVRQTVLSAYRQDSLESLLREKRLTPMFDLIVGADDHYAHGKAAQGRLLKKQLGSSSRILMVGDTLHDVVVATEMDVDCVLVYGGHQSLHRLESSGVRVFGDLEQLQQWLTGGR